MPDDIGTKSKTDWERAIRRCAKVRYDEHGEEVLTARLVDVLRENEKISREEGTPSTGLRLRLKSGTTTQQDQPPWETQRHQIIEVTPDHLKYEAARARLDRVRRRIKERIAQTSIF